MLKQEESQIIGTIKEKKKKNGGKGEIARYEQFLLFCQCFHGSLYSWYEKYKYFVLRTQEVSM